jgi:hypothetical protein
LIERGIVAFPTNPLVFLAELLQDLARAIGGAIVQDQDSVEAL